MKAHVTNIYADQAFYREAAEPEQVLTGTLARHESPLGPANRPHSFRLQTDDGRLLDVYATPAAHERLAPLVGARLRIRGKLVDLSREGFGVELWIGELEAP